MSMIQISNLTFAYPGQYENIFEQVSLYLDSDWKLGLIGRNGKGKTSLLRLLLGSYDYEGSISAQVEFAYFPYDLSDKTIITADLFYQQNPDVEQWEIERELSLLAVTEDVLTRPFSSLSPGEQTKVSLATLFLKENVFPLIDEPTNHLDEAGREILARYLRKKNGFILVSHDRWLLDQCVDHILAMNRSQIELQQGNFSSWQENKERQDQFEQGQNEKLTKEIKRLAGRAKETKQWADYTERQKIGYDPIKEDRFIGTRAFLGEKSRKMQQKRKNLERRQEKAIAEKADLLKNVEKQESLKCFPLVYPKNELLRLEHVSVLYEGKTICRPTSFSVGRGERVALVGKNGCGKSSLLKVICGESIDYQGSLLISSGLKISYVPQSTDFLHGDLSTFARENAIDETLFKTILRKLDFSREQFEKDMASFSEGQKKKVLLARSLSEEAHIFIWDEPLNFIDVISRMQIEETLLKYAPTMIFVEHDSVFRKKIATKTVEIIRSI